MQRRLARRSSVLHSKRHRLAFELLEPRLNLALDVPAFSSLPGANHTIYLDFDGHVTTGTSWNSGATINSPAYSSDADTASARSIAPQKILHLSKSMSQPLRLR